MVKAPVEVADDLLLVHVLADEDYLLHAVTVFFVPVLEEVRVLAHQFETVFFRRGGIPLSGFAQELLFSCLLEKI